MKIIYISLGSFCHPKIFIRETNREIQVSLPFDFHLSLHTPGITNCLKELLTTGDVDIQFNEIEKIDDENNVLVQDKFQIGYLHFFKTEDLLSVPDSFPASIDHIKPESINAVKEKFKKRFKTLLDILQKVENTILCFMRIENYDNPHWETEIRDLTLMLSLFKHPNKYLLYAQDRIPSEKHYMNTRKMSYDYGIPVLFYKYYFYDEIFFFKKHYFVNCIQCFELFINDHPNIINIEHPFTKIIQKFYLDHEKNQVLALTNLNFFSNFHKFDDKIVFNDALNGYMFFKLEEKEDCKVYCSVENF